MVKGTLPLEEDLVVAGAAAVERQKECAAFLIGGGRSPGPCRRRGVFFPLPIRIGRGSVRLLQRRERRARERDQGLRLTRRKRSDHQGRKKSHKERDRVQTAHCAAACHEAPP